MEHLQGNNCDCYRVPSRCCSGAPTCTAFCGLRCPKIHNLLTLQGYAHVKSAALGHDSIRSSFHGAAADVCEVVWIKFGEFSKNIFSGMPAIVRSHAPGTVFNRVRNLLVMLWPCVSYPAGLRDVRVSLLHLVLVFNRVFLNLISSSAIMCRSSEQTL